MSGVDISVIIPIYYGGKYIPSLIKQIECCKRKLDSNIQVELLLINDCPEEPLENYASKDISIRVFQTEVNRGIQGARIKGVDLSKGRYVLMLDQDDKIREKYLQSQLENIEKHRADASVCRAMDANSPVYGSKRRFEEVINLENMLQNNYILSPGQVLVRKESLSSVWKSNLLDNNGADDWLLWICMMAEGKKFVLNSQCLYEHIVNGENASNNTNVMIDSVRETVQILKEQNLFTSEQIVTLENHPIFDLRQHIQSLERYKKLYYFYKEWMGQKNREQLLSTQLKKKNYMNIAIYGLSAIGRQIIKDLKDTEICIEYVIDREAEYYKMDDIDLDITICTINEISEQKEVDVIIVTVMEQGQFVMQQLKKRVTIPIIYMKDILFS